MKKLSLVFVLFVMFVSSAGAANLIEHFEKYGLKLTKETAIKAPPEIAKAIFDLEFNYTESARIYVFDLKNPGLFYEGIKKDGGFMFGKGTAMEVFSPAKINKTNKIILVLFVDV